MLQATEHTIPVAYCGVTEPQQDIYDFSLIRNRRDRRIRGGKAGTGGYDGVAPVHSWYIDVVPGS